MTLQLHLFNRETTIIEPQWRYTHPKHSDKYVSDAKADTANLTFVGLLGEFGRLYFCS